jgi:hypothetical protein
MDEAYYFEALGVPAPKPAEKQEDADPADKGGSEGTGDQGDAGPGKKSGQAGDPAGDPDGADNDKADQDEDPDEDPGEDKDGDPDKDGDSDKDSDKDADKKKQSRRTDKKFAEARRQFERERDAAVAKAKEDAKAELDRMVAAMGLKNPFTGELIKTKAEYDEAVTKKAAEKAEQALKKSGLSTELLKDIVKELPEVKEAREAAESFKAATEKAELEKARLAAEAEVKEISKIDPAIQSIEDFKKMPDYEEFRNLVVNNKLTYIQAFRLLRFEKLTQGREAGAERQAAFNAASKNHLQRSDSAGDGDVTVTREDIDRFRAMFPDMSTKEITEYVKRHAKNTKKTE